MSEAPKQLTPDGQDGGEALGANKRQAGMRLLLEAASTGPGSAVAGAAGQSQQQKPGPFSDDTNDADEDAKKRRRIQYALSALSKGSMSDSVRRELEEKVGTRRGSMSAAASATTDSATPKTAAQLFAMEETPEPESGSTAAAQISGPKCDNGFTRTFPQRLMEVLSRKDTENAIVWMPDGLSFVIISPRAFVAQVLPNFFKQTKFASFTRKLNRWGFKRITRGVNAGAYCHKLFQRDNPNLCLQMFCQKSDEAKQHAQHGGNVSQLSPAMVDQLVQQRAMLQAQGQPVGSCNPLLMSPMNPINQSFMGNHQCMMQPNMSAPKNVGMLTPQQIAVLQQQKMLDVASAQIRMNMTNMNVVANQQQAPSQGNGVHHQQQQGQGQQHQPSMQAPDPAMMALFQQQEQSQRLQALQAQNKLLGLQPPTASNAMGMSQSPRPQGTTMAMPNFAGAEQQQGQGSMMQDQNVRGTKLVNRAARGA